jgi:hypothetical protein
MKSKKTLIKGQYVEIKRVYPVMSVVKKSMVLDIPLSQQIHISPSFDFIEINFDAAKNMK